MPLNLVYRTIPPVNAVLPVITGTPEIGETLSVTTGTWANSPTGYTYQWKRDNVAIGGATANTYLIPSTTGGLSCTVTATNMAGSASVRASSGNPRQLWLCGDSLTSPVDYGTAVQSAIDAYFGSGAWIVYNVARSSENIADMEVRVNAEADPYVHHGHGLMFFHEYANQVVGIQGSDTGADVAALLFTFGESRVVVGGLPLYCTSPYNGSQTGGHTGTQAHIASELVRAGYGSHGGVSLVDFDDANLLASINAFDGVHWTSEVYDLCAAKTVAAIVSAGLTGGCGDIRIYEPVFVNLRTHTNPGYVYDPINPLPYPPVATHIQITAGTGWDLVTHVINGSVANFITDDGPQVLYQLDPPQTSGSLSSGTYLLS